MSGFQSSWGNTQQNQQQQQQQPNTFGQASGFGTSAFGGSSAFGQNPQQQQPAANPMFGNLGGTPNTNTSTTGFGAFGNTANTPQSTSAFGATKPTTGFGAFGGGTTFGGGAFGQNNTPASGSGTTTGLFGQPAATSTTGAFGTGMFGANKSTTSGFGTATATTPGTTAPVTTGSSNPPFQAYTEKENGSSGPVNIQYQAISCMPAYQGTSHEEIRYQDYLQGRKTAGAFGQSATFGTTQPTNTGIFGTQPAQQNQPSAFGGGTTTTGFGGFGAPATNQSTTAPVTTSGFGGGIFGQQPQQQPQQQSQQQPQQSTFSGFGNTSQQPQQQQSGSLFGSTFGSNAAKPGGFSAFGGSGGSAFGGGGAFGQQQQQQQQQQQPGGSLFGNTQTQPASGFNAFSNTGNKSIFGGTQPTTTAPTGFGNFGTNQQQTQPAQQQQQPSLFGGGTGTGLFGGGNQQQQQNPQQPANNPLFSNTNPQTGGGLFGGANLFGGSNQQQQQQQPGQTGAFNLFGGSKPAAPNQSIFSSGFNQQPANNAQQSSIFGAPLGQSTNQQSTLGGSLFGNKPGAPSLGSSTSTGQGGLFGSSAPSGILNASTNTPNAQGSLTASISQPIGANLAIFDMLPPGPRLVNLESSQPKKKYGFFVDIPTRSPVPRVQLGYTPANSKLRGFGSSTLTSSAAGGNPFANLSFTSGKPNALSLSRISDKPAVGADPFLSRSSSPSLGSGVRQSVKKVILDKKVDPSELFTKSGSPGSLHGGKVVFSPALSVAVREKDATAALASSVNGVAESPTPAPRPQRSPTRFTAQSTQYALQPAGASDPVELTALEEGDYWVKPDLATLKRTGYDELSAFKDLVVGRKGYGEIHFLEPVDLTGLPKLGALLGEIIRFDDKECSVYPDSEEVDKPAPGSGLNVRARLTLVRCWAADKATREPIKDAKHPAAAKHLKRLKNMKDTHFESFDIAEGKWTFVVDHF